MTTPAQIDDHPEQPINLIDTHVHLYDCFDRTTFFNAALKNFQHAATSLGLPGNTPASLMLTETCKDHAFDSLIEQRELAGGHWHFRETGDGQSLVASHDNQDVLTVVAGRQIVTREGLEVLALCCNDTFTDGQTIQDTIEKVLEADALPVIPYGVGKWTGARAKVLENVLNGPHSSKLFLGDNAGRLALAGEPKQFAEARKRGIWTLHGTDPLPLASQAKRVARAVMILKGDIDPDKPAASINRLIEASNEQPGSYFTGDNLINFLKLQVAMQLRKRLRRKS